MVRNQFFALTHQWKRKRLFTFVHGFLNQIFPSFMLIDKFNLTSGSAVFGTIAVQGGQTKGEHPINEDLRSQLP